MNIDAKAHSNAKIIADSKRKYHEDDMREYVLTEDGKIIDPNYYDHLPKEEQAKFKLKDLACLNRSTMDFLFKHGFTLFHGPDDAGEKTDLVSEKGDRGKKDEKTGQVTDTSGGKVEKFAVGDVVLHRSQNIAARSSDSIQYMVVGKIMGNGMVWCQWVVDGEAKNGHFDERELDAKGTPYVGK